MTKTVFSDLLVMLLLSLALVTTSCGNSSNEGTTSDTTGTNNRQAAVANLSGVYNDTTVNGTARFEQADDGKVKLNLEITIPAKANQQVAVHIHENGSCDDHAHAAGGHWNPTGENHGRWGQGAFHSGDIGNVSLDGEGKGTIELETDRWSIGGDQQKDILNKSLMVHSGIDDYASQPAGNAGNRIGCAVITKGN